MTPEDHFHEAAINWIQRENRDLYDAPRKRFYNRRTLQLVTSFVPMHYATFFSPSVAGEWIFLEITFAASTLSKNERESRNVEKLNRFQVHRKDERTFRFDFRRGSKSELQSRNPAFSLGKAEDYGNRYGGDISEKPGEAHIGLDRCHSRYTLLHVLGQGRKSLVGIRISIHIRGNTLEKELNMWCFELATGFFLYKYLKNILLPFPTRTYPIYTVVLNF